ncbi:c-type cytochrome [Marivita sp. S2033]|uniref:c-type cytochrome n=1 Tax=Marivita sp. S2033 TaxID=3373187 RepID=UPI003981B560
MLKFPKGIASAALFASSALVSSQALAEEKLGLGREALPEEIAAWDVAVRPDGTGLPEGSGSAADGEILFSDNCAACHGEFAEGVDNWPSLAGGEGTLADEDPVKTVGSYWPYLSTAWDYIHRSMPYGNAQSLSDDDVYAIVAYILYSNFLVDDDFVLSNENFLEVEMPNADGFIVDDRAETEYPQWRAEPCMSACKDSVEITMRATVLDVTPNEEGTEALEKEAVIVPADAVKEEADVVVAEAAALDPELVADGEKVFRQCKACHMVGEGAKNRVGPALNGIVGGEIATVEGFRYSSALEGLDGVWSEDALAAYLADPRGYAKGTKMSFAGLRKPEDIKAVTEYLKSFDG